MDKIKKNNKTIGMLGGMGPIASANLYHKIITTAHDLYNAEQDTDFPPMIIYNLPLFGFNEIGFVNFKFVKEQLIAGVKKLEKAGSDFIIIACNTVHYFFKDMQSAIKIPIISIIEETANVVKKEGYKKIGLLSSESTNELNIYQKVFNNFGIKIISVSNKEQLILNEIIFNVMSGKQGEDDKEKLNKIINDLIKKGAESVVLGCTELPLVIDQESSRTKLFFSTDIIAEASLKKSMEK